MSHRPQHMLPASPFARRWSAIAIALAVSYFGLFAVGARADTTATPDTTTKAAINPASPNVDPPGPFSVAQGTKINVHVAGQTGQVFAISARLCKPNLDVQTASQLTPSQFGNCLTKPFHGTASDDSQRTDDSFVSATSDGTHTFADLTFTVGSGTQTFNKSNGQPTTITCDSSNPCALWIQEQVSGADDGSPNVFKHYDLNYGSSPTTVPPTTTPTTVPPTTTPTTVPPTTTPTTVHTTTTNANTSTTLHTTTTNANTSTTLHTTTTVASGATTTVVAGTGTTSTTAAPSDGLAVSPSTLSPNGTLSINAGGWLPGATVTVTLFSTPVQLATFTAAPNGVVSGNVVIPAGTAPGSHTITLAGQGAGNVARSISSPITVVAAASTNRSLVRTGANVLRTLWGGCALLAVGLFLAQSAKRRRSTDAAASS